MSHNQFFNGYLECALWSSSDDNDDPMDQNYTVTDIDPATIAKMQADCEQFQTDNVEALGLYYSQRIAPYVLECAGHDFWLSRNGHGAGFFDRDEVDTRVCDLLQSASEAFTSFDLYVGDDGAIYGS